MTTLTAQPETLSASLIDALSGPETERALEQAFLQLARGGDLPLVLAMLKALVRVGLAGMASRLLNATNGSLAAQPQLAALADQLAHMPSGEVARHVLDSRLQRNIAQVMEAHARLTPLVEQWRCAVEDVSVFVSRTGNVHAVRGDIHSRRIDLIFPFADQISHARSLKLPDVSLNSSFLLVGVPAPALFDRLLSLQTAAGYRPPIDIIETDSQVFGLWLHLIETATAFADERVNVFVGDGAVNEYREFLVNHPWRRPATHCTTNFRPRWTPPIINGRFHESVADAIAARQQRAASLLESKYAHRDAAFWSKRFQQAIDGGPPLRIAGFTTRYSTVIQHSMRDLAAAFERRGHVFDVIKQPNSSCAHVDVIGSLAKNDHDLIVVIDHLRREFAGSMPANIPFVCWIQDHMDALYARDAGSSVTDLDLVIGHSPGLMHSAHGYPLERFIASSNLTDPHTFSAEPLPESELAPHRCDVSYVGHASGTPQALAAEIASQAPDAFHKCLLKFIQLARPRFEANGWLSFADRMELALQAERESGHPPLAPALRRRILLPAIDRLFDRIVRHQTLEWTGNWARSRGRIFRIYGCGWDRHPAFASFAAGEIANGRPLRAVYQASAVSLQVTGYSSLHQRLLDGLCSGALMITRFNPFDFLRQPHSVVQDFMQESHIESLSALFALAQSQPHVANALASLEALGHARLAPDGDAVRAKEAALYREVFDASSDALTDAGMFSALASGSFIPHRSACDLPGFASLTFRTEPQLHELLDQLVDDKARRDGLAAPMRESILQHDTHDSLVQRIVEKFAGR